MADVAQMDLKIIYKGEDAGYLNRRLVEKQKLTEKDVEILKDLHVQKNSLFEKMERLSDPSELKKCVELLESIEFAMQKAWKFTQDAAFHTWWCQAPKCACPKLDNRDRYGTGERIFSSDCVLHGQPAVKEKKPRKKPTQMRLKKVSK